MSDLQERFNRPASWTEGYMTNARGNKLRWGGSVPPQAKAHIVYVSGLSEYAEKTFELSRDFNRQACGFWTLDRQGQGLSGRYLADKFKQHSQGLHHDAADLVQMVRQIVPRDGKPVILLGHSTGGLISLLALEQARDKFAAAFLTAPLLGIENGLIKNRESLMAKIPLPQFLREKYLKDGGAWRLRNSPESTQKEDFYSSDQDRMKIHNHWQMANAGLRVGNATYGWLQEVCRAIVKIQDAGFLSSIKTPVHVFCAGKESLVNNRLVERAYMRLPNGSYTFFPMGKHELLMEQDYIRDHILQSVVSFVQRTPAP